MHSTVVKNELPADSRALVRQAQSLVVEVASSAATALYGEEAERGSQAHRKRRGAPQQISWPHLWLSLLWSVLLGMDNYQDWRRSVASEPVGSFQPVILSSSALVKRLQQGGLRPLQQYFLHCNHALASQIVALDESTLDSLARHLSWQRALPKGHAALLPGKLAGLFDIRQQCWVNLQFRPDAQQNCKVDVLSLLEGLPWHSLILFDLGYFSFAWFDYLTSMGYWWISRLREKTSYQILHVYYQHGVILDALVWLVKYVPSWIQRGISPVEWVLTYGRELGFIRPSSRIQVQAPCIPEEELLLPPAGLILIRRARYLEYAPRPGRPSYNKKKPARPKAAPSP